MSCSHTAASIVLALILGTLFVDITEILETVVQPIGDCAEDASEQKHLTGAYE